jgi:hypothetical protein
METDRMNHFLAEQRILASQSEMPAETTAFAYGEHLEAFLDMATKGEWKRTIPNKWIRHVTGVPLLTSDLGNKSVDRADLTAACRDPNVPDRDLLWAILAWGRMRIGAAKRFAQNEGAWSALVGRFRQGDMTRTACYTACRDLTQALPSGGIGPAFFTKLIFFANPRHDGYIMDQWTSRSVNLLVSGPPVVLMRTRNHVDPRNTADHYERFCQVVEDLSWRALSCNREVPLSPEDIERCLFSTGYPQPAPWRRYVVEQG